MGRKKTPKILNAHAKRRASERYGVNLNRHARRDIVKLIQTNKAEFVSKFSNNRSLWRVPYQDESLNVVYDKQRETLCTVLPRDAEEFQPGWQQPEAQATEVKKQQTHQQITDELTKLWTDESC